MEKLFVLRTTASLFFINLKSFDSFKNLKLLKINNFFHKKSHESLNDFF